jgi:hypothetical protein
VLKKNKESKEGTKRYRRGRKIPTLRRSSAEALSSGFFTKHRARKSLKSLDQFSGSLSVGGGCKGIRKMA